LPTAPDGGAAGGAMLADGLLDAGRTGAALDGTAPVRAVEQPVATRTLAKASKVAVRAFPA